MNVACCDNPQWSGSNPAWKRMFIQLSGVDRVSQGPELTARTRIKASFLKFYYQRCYIVWLSHLPDVICVCGRALCERLNPLPSNDAFMLPVSLCLCLHLPIIYWREWANVNQTSNDIKAQTLSTSDAFSPWCRCSRFFYCFALGFCFHTCWLTADAVWWCVAAANHVNLHISIHLVCKSIHESPFAIGLPNIWNASMYSKCDFAMPAECFHGRTKSDTSMFQVALLLLSHISLGSPRVAFRRVTKVCIRCMEGTPAAQSSLSELFYHVALSSCCDQNVAWFSEGLLKTWTLKGN